MPSHLWKVLEAEETTGAHAVAADLKCSAGLARQVKSKLGAPVWEKADKSEPGDIIPTQSGDKTTLNVIIKHLSQHKVTLQKVMYTEMRVNIMTSWSASTSALIGSCFPRYALIGRVTSRSADCAAMYSTFCGVSLITT
jgi:hypothetical protein